MMAEKKKIAVIVPTYPPHFERSEALMASFIRQGYDKQADLIFVLTNEEEAELFQLQARTLILPERLRIFNKDGKRSGIINIKKFYAIRELKEEYAYLIVMDSESMFVNHQNLLSICYNYYKRRILIGNKTLRNPSKIVGASLKWFPENKKLNSIKLFLWFNQPCIYKTEWLDDFFEKTKIYENLTTLCFHDFDYYIFMYYLIEYREFEISETEIVARWGFCQGSFFVPLGNKWKENTYYICNQNLKYFIPQNKIFAFIQLDKQEEFYYIPPPGKFVKLMIAILKEITTGDSRRFFMNVYNKINR